MDLTAWLLRHTRTGSSMRPLWTHRCWSPSSRHYNRNVGVVGEQKAQSTSGCRYTEVESYSASGAHLGTNRSQITCSGSANHNFTVPANVVGGAAFVHVFLVYWTSWDDYRTLVGVRLDR